MKYIANPVEVDANRIISVGERDSCGATPLALENGVTYSAPIQQTVHYSPFEGDYVAVHSDGTVDVIPAELFEQKYSIVS